MTTPHSIESLVEPLYRLNRDMLKALRQGGGGITDSEARYLVDIYYTMQVQRVRCNNQVKGLDRDATKIGNVAEPHTAIDWTLKQFGLLEEQVAKLLAIYTESHPMAWFFEQTVGIGPVLAAGLLAHIDIRRAPTVGHIWRFAGLDPTTKWEKKSKRPWNAELKKLCWKIGDSFVKFSGHERGVYGRVYRERKLGEWQRNLAGELASQAAAALAAKKIDKSTDAHAWYSGACSPDRAREVLELGKSPTAAECRADDGQGVPMLPPAQIDMRARRYAVKLFLSHLHECWYRQEMGVEPPNPYAIQFGGHAHKIAPPQIPPASGAVRVLSQECGEPQRRRASHRNGEPQKSRASHCS